MVFSAILVLFGAREAGCFREMAALRSDHYAYRQIHCTTHAWMNA